MSKVVEAEGRINGVKIARTAPCITHLMFVDDSEIERIYFRKIGKHLIQSVMNLKLPMLDGFIYLQMHIYVLREEYNKMVSIFF